MAAPSSNRAGRWAWWEVLAGLAVSAVPVWLLFERGANFYYDWHNHQWLVGYFGEHLRSQGTLPEVLNTTAAVGMPQPVFYGFLLYPGLGVLSAVLGASLALRAGIALTLVAQYFAVYLAGRKLGAPRAMSLVVAASVAWSVHSLTNLYNRAALTEFFAVAFLNIAVALGVAAMAETSSPRERLAGGWLAMLAAVLTVGAHPPTALVSAGLFAVLVPLALVELGRRNGGGGRNLRWLGVGAGLGVVALAPWLYANLQYRGGLGIVGKYRDFSYSVDHIDAVGARFSPWPPDLWRRTASEVGATPYVEAPLQFALLLLAGWNLLVWWRAAGGRPEGSRREERWLLRLAGVGGAWFGLTLLLSLVPAVGGAFRFLAPYVQFATRFVSHANLGLLVVVLATGGLVTGCGGDGRFRRGNAVVMAVAFAAALAAGVIKLRHGASVREAGGEPQYAWSGARAALVTAGKADAAGDYAVLKALPQLTPQTVARARPVALPVGERGDAFGRVGEARITLAAPGWVITNLVAFPWNRVTVNGREEPGTRYAANEYRLALHLPAGLQVIAWRWQPDPVWRGLVLAARWALLALGAGAVLLVVRAPRPHSR